MSNATLEEQDELLEEPLEGNDDDEPEWCLETPLTASQHGELSNNDISQISITKRKKFEKRCKSWIIVKKKMKLWMTTQVCW